MRHHCAVSALALALLMAFGCVAAAEPRLGGRPWSKVVVSAGSGIALAYLIVHLLPEVASDSKTWEFAAGWIHYDNLHAYIFLLLGIFGTLALRFFEKGQHGMAPHPQTAILQPAVASILVGYVLASGDDGELGSLLLFSLAIGLHMVISAHALATRLDTPLGGIVLAAGIAVGFAVGSVTSAPSEVIAGATAVLAGGVMTHTINEVQDEERHFGALAVGAVFEAALLYTLV